ncbi:MAG: DUF4258 domain-containing protein [Chloroflexi bacterium]|nr:DUF4258 domain-containing protein [Chloroflexota bacterium]
MELRDIVAAILATQVRITRHALHEAQADGLRIDEIYFSVLRGEIIAEYLDDKPFPSCLIYGQTFDGEHIHTVWGYNESSQHAILITVYRPDPGRWIDWRERRRQ